MKNSDIRTIKLGIWPADHVPLYPSSTVPQSSSAPVCWGASSQHLCLCTVRMPLRVPAPQLISMACACAERGREGGGDGSFLLSFFLPFLIPFSRLRSRLAQPPVLAAVAVAVRGAVAVAAWLSGALGGRTRRGADACSRRAFANTSLIGTTRE